MKTLELIKNENRLNKKIELLKEGLNDINEYLIRKSLNDEVFGISNKTLMKVFNITSLKGFNDIGEWIEKYIHEDINSYSLEEIEVIFHNVKKKSGDDLINYLKNKFIYDHKGSNEIKWLVRALNKDLKINMGITQINKVFYLSGKPLIERFQTQLCKGLKINELDKLKNYPYICETKYDGTRSIIFIKKINNNLSLIDNEFEIKIISRQGKETTKQFPEIIREVKKFLDINNHIKNIVLDGEIISNSFNNLQKRLGRKIENIKQDNSLQFIAFDILNINNINLKDTSFKLRRENLQNLNYTDKLKLSLSQIVNNKKDLIQFYNEQIALKEEGIIVKDINGKYAKEKKDERKGQWKIKPILEGTFKIIDLLIGKNKYNNLYNVFVIEDKSKKLHCKVGSGLSDKLIEEINNKGKNFYLGKFLDVSYQEVSAIDKKISLRFPVFLKFRYDKEEADDYSKKM